MACRIADITQGTNVTLPEMTGGQIVFVTNSGGGAITISPHAADAGRVFVAAQATPFSLPAGKIARIEILSASAMVMDTN